MCFTCELDAPTLLDGSRGKGKYFDIGIQQVDGLYAFCMGGWHKTTVVSACGVDALKSYVRYFLFEKYKNFWYNIYVRKRKTISAILYMV